MELSEIIKELPLQQRKYVIACALRAPDNFRDLKFIGEPTVNQWQLTDPRFNEAVQIVKDGDFVVEAVKLWVEDRVLSYLQEMDIIARSKGMSRVKLEALKHLLSMAGTDKKVFKEQLTAIEEYILGNKKITLIAKGER